MRLETRKIALGGVLSALSVTVMLLGGILPFATFVAPALAGLFLWPLKREFSVQTGITAYVAVGFLAFFFVPDKEQSLIFLFLLGFYPMIKEKLDKIHKTVLLLLAKVLLFNGLVFFMYSLILFVFPISEIVQEFATSSFALTIGLVLLSNFVFLLYDFALVRVRLLYEYRLRPLLFGGAR